MVDKMSPPSETNDNIPSPGADLFRQMIENSPVSVTITTLGEGRVLETNRGTFQHLGYTREELIGRTTQELKIWANTKDRDQFLETVRRDGMVQNLELTYRKKSGELATGLVTAYEVEYQGQACLIVMVLDISERKQKELEMEALVSISESFRTTVPYAEIFPILFDQVQALLRTDAIALVLREPTASQHYYSPEDRLVIRAAKGAWESLTGLPVWHGEIFATGIQTKSEPYLNNDVQEDPTLRGDRIVQNLTAIASAPLSSDGGRIGALWIGCAQHIRTEEIRLLFAIASITANALHRAMLYEQTELHLQRLTTLRAIDQAITASLDLRVTLNILINQITVQLRIDAANVLLFDPHTQMLEYAAGRNLDRPEFKNIRLRLGESSAGGVALTRKVDYITDISSVDPVFSRKLADAGFKTYIALPLIAKGRIKGVLELFHRARIDPDPEWLDFLHAIAAQAAIAIDNADLFDQLQRSNTHLTLAYDATIESWSRALELHGRELPGHALRVTEFTLQLARLLRLDEHDLIHIQRGSLLHDIGKLAVPDAILFKPGPLDPEEWEIMKRHPVHSYEMLLPIEYLRPALDIPLYHHERWDGSGYPNGLRGEAIPLAARIFGAADVWDALCNPQVYRPAWPRAEAYAYMMQQSGALFDPRVIEAFVQRIGPGKGENFEE